MDDRSYVLRYKGFFWREGEKYMVFEPIVTLEMAERIAREAQAEKASRYDARSRAEERRKRY